jgi:multidrug efflux system membrane fusion protein
MNIRIPNTPQTTAASRQNVPPQWQRTTPRWKIVVGLVALALLGLIIWRLFFSQSNVARQSPPPPVKIAQAEERNVAGLEHSIGTVVSISTVQVAALVSGQLLSTGFAEGQIVKTGQLLFQIDPRPFAAALAQARAALARDEANTVSAQHDKIRFTTLAAQGAASAQQRDQAIAAADADEAIVQSDKAAIQTAELNLGYTAIRSPITGKTGPLLIQPGNVITANNTTAPLVTITQLQPIKVSMFLPQSDLAMIQQQMAAHQLRMTVSPNASATAPSFQINGGTAPVAAPQPAAGSWAALTARVNFVGNQVDAKTGTVELRATFDNNDFRLVPGQLLDAAVSLSNFPHATVVPREAVNVGPDSRYVFVLDARSRAQMRAVDVLYDDGVNAAIRGAVKPGDRVIVEGQLRVVPNEPVQIQQSAQGRAQRGGR